MKRTPIIRLLLFGALLTPLLTLGQGPRVAMARTVEAPKAEAPLQAVNNLQVFALRYDADLNKRAAVAVAKQAAFIIAGGGNQTTLPKARTALQNPESAREAFIWYIVMDSSVQAAPTNDTAIETVVATFYADLWAAGS